MSPRSRVLVRTRTPIHAAWIAPLLVAVLVAAVQLVGPARSEPTPPRPVELDQSSWTCPLGTGLVAAGQVEAGRRATALARPSGQEVGALETPDRWRTATVRGDALTLEQNGRGSGAVGFVGGRAAGSAGGGLVVSSCPAASGDAWFLGAGSSRGHDSTLVLSNVTDAPAVVAVRLWNASGPVEAVGGDALVVEPQSTRAVRLTDLATGEPELAVHVERVRGAVSIALRDARSGGRGSEVMPATLTPRRTQTVGVVPAAGGRSLLLLNPSTRTARVSVRASGPDGRFAPQGLSSVRVQPGALTSVELPAGLARQDLALSLSSAVPVAAAVQTVTGSDTATVPALGDLDQTAVVPIALDRRRVPTLVLAGTGTTSGAVRLEAYGADLQRLDAARVRVPVGTSTRVDLAEALDLGDAAYVLVRGAPGLVATARYADGDRFALLPLRDAPVRGAGPQVRAAP